MKNISFVLLLIVIPAFLYGQKRQLFPVKSRIDSLKFTVVNQGNQLTIRYENLPQDNNFPSVIGLRLLDSDLVLDYEYTGKNSKFSVDAIRLNNVISLQGSSFFPQEGDLQQIDKKMKDKKGMKGTRTWFDAAENMLLLGESYTLVLERSIMDRIDCQAEEPSFSLKQKLPYYFTEGAGLVALGMGQIVYRRQRREAITAYQKAWKNGEFHEEAQADFEKAKDKDKKVRIWTASGIGLITIGYAGLLYRQLKIRKKHKLYKTHCTQSSETTLQLLPVIDIPYSGKEFVGSNLGVQLIWQF